MSLHQRITAHVAVADIIDAFYNRALGDRTLAPMFAGVDPDFLKHKQSNFFTALLRFEPSTVDPYLRESHLHLVAEKGLGDAHFDTLMAHLAIALKEVGVPEAEAGEVMRAARNLRNSVLCR